MGMQSQDDFSRAEFIQAAALVASVKAGIEWDSFHGPQPGMNTTKQTILTRATIEGRVLTKKEAAAFLSISVPTMDRMRKRGEVQAVELLLPSIRYRMDDLVQLRDGRR